MSIKFNADALFALVSDMNCTVKLGARSGEPVIVRESLADFPLIAIEKFLRYGFQREVNDGVGGKDKSLTDKVKAARVMIDRYKAGEVGRAPSESVDPVTDIARTMAKDSYRASDLEKWNAFIADAKKQADSTKVNIKTLINAELDRIIALNPFFLDDAQEELDRRAEKVKIKINLG